MLKREKYDYMMNSGYNRLLSSAERHSRISTFKTKGTLKHILDIPHSSFNALEFQGSKSINDSLIKNETLGRFDEFRLIQ